jgi:hypothetical protein
MSATTYNRCSVTSMLTMLQAYADADRPMSAVQLAALIGVAANSGIKLRRALIDAGWLDVIEPPRGNLPGRVSVTDAGRAALRDRPMAVAKPVTTSAPRVRKEHYEAAPAAALPTTTKRRCLSCGSHFDSAGPGNRICGSCRSTDAHRASDAGSYAVRLR